MSAENISSLYPKVALLIHQFGMEVTTEKIESAFKALGAEYLPKIGELFALPGEKIESYLSFVGAAPQAVVEEKKEEKVEETKEEVKDEPIEIGFDDLFD